MKFLIGYPHGGPVTNIGGVQALKKLVDMLTDRGQTVYVIGTSFLNSKSIMISEWFTHDISEIYSDDLIVIYPEVVQGNPYDCKHVVRWILYHTLGSGVEGGWAETDEYFYLLDYYNTQRTPEKRLLHAFNFRLDEFNDLGYEREGYCHLIKKNNVETSFVQQYNSDHIPVNDWPATIEMFNRKKYFLTYDDSTYFLNIAALCGCIPVVLYKEPKALDYKERYPTMKYGVAHGFEEIEYAKNTLPLMRSQLEELEKLSYQTVDDFINFWEKKLKV